MSPWRQIEKNVAKKSGGGHANMANFCMAEGVWHVDLATD